ncbi:MAG: PIG-L family deacetylase, partial [Clostridia bacterium]|nr:PIG-L family deacetylase [Clostridia bacterium]
MIINSENVKLNYYKKAPFITQKMCIAAHQDDVEIMAYAQIADCYNTGGFSAVVLTDGAGSPRTGKFSGVSDEEMKNIRICEQRKAAEIGNYDSLIQ